MALPAILGGAGLSVAAHELLLLTGGGFGVSGFVHRSLHGSTDGLAAFAGLVVAGALVAVLEDTKISSPMNASPAWIFFSGLLVGVGSKLSNGCTSGHMICGISRLSPRSIAATATFFIMATLVANITYGDVITHPVSPLSSWPLSWKTKTAIILQATIFLTVSAFYTILQKVKLPSPLIQRLRLLTYFTTALQFGLALFLADLTDPRRVVGFLLPFRKGFDPSLLFVAGSAISLGIPLFKFVYGRSKGEKGPNLGNDWSWNNSLLAIDKKLILGSAIFGCGWGLIGVCPGPGIVNFGRALHHGQILSPYTLWTAALAAGGFVVDVIESTAFLV